MHLCLFEDDAAHHLAPLTSTRAVFDLRPGLRTLGDVAREAVAEVTSSAITLALRPLVADVVAARNLPARVLTLPDDLALPAADAPTLWLNAGYAAHPGPVLDRLREAARLADPVALWQRGTLVGAVTAAGQRPTDAPVEEIEDGDGAARLVTRLWHLAPHVRTFIEADIAARPRVPTARRGAGGVDPGAILVEPDRIHMMPGSRIRAGAIVSAEAGPVLLAEGAEILEGAVVRGPVIVGPRSQVKPLASIEGTTIGPDCKVGGEVHTSIFQRSANKGHSGFLGHSVIGAWCNLGASTDVSNLRNDYGPVTMWDRADGDFAKTGQQFLGLVMGDHSKCSIGTTFNTGTVVGVGCNLYDAGFHDRHVPDFSWGTPGQYVPYRFDKFETVADAVVARRHRVLTDAERTLLRTLATERL